LVFHCEKVLVIFEDGKANDVRVTPRWCIHQSETIKRIIASIAKLIRLLLISGQLPQDLPLECLSCMMGNYLVQFLGGDGAAMPLTYPIMIIELNLEPLVVPDLV
jgi:hypothetical protein